MAPRSSQLPKTGFAVEIDGRIKAEFNTREGAENGAIELKRRFPALRIRLYDEDAIAPRRPGQSGVKGRHLPTFQSTLVCCISIDALRADRRFADLVISDVRAQTDM